MKHIIQFSGGAASALVAILVAEKEPKENIVLLHNDTFAEDPDKYRFMDDISNHLDIPITFANDGRSLWQVIDDENALPSFFMPFCTRILKQEPAEHFYAALQEDFILHNGFSFDEWMRVQRATARGDCKNRVVKSPLFEQKLNSHDAKKLLLDKGFELPRAYQFLRHNNCIPCFKAGPAEWQKYWKYYPCQFDKAVACEEQTGYTVFKDYSLKEFAQMCRRGNMENLFEKEIPCECWSY